MPWSVREDFGDCRGWAVVKEGTDEIEGCHGSREDAVQQQRALYASEASARRDTVESTMSTSRPLVIAAPDDFIERMRSVTSTAGRMINVMVTEQEEEVSLRWKGVLTLEGVPTGDGRFFAAGAWSWRDPPLTLMAQTVNEEGHRGAEVAGRIDRLWKEERPDLGEGAAAVMAEGEFEPTEFGREIARMVKSGTLRGASVDYGVQEAALRDPETGEMMEQEDLELADVLFGRLEHVALKAEIQAATVVPTPAFADAMLSPIEEVTADGSRRTLGLRQEPQIWSVSDVLTASAAGLAPLKPPKAWFEQPEPDGPVPLTVTEEGQVFGHLARWGQCHTGLPHCQTPPRSASGYRYFHLGEIETAEGEKVAVGRITVGNLGHAPIHLNGQKTVEHYDNSGCVAAFVQASDGVHGIWLAGAVRSDLPAEKVRDLRANPPSGDWRREGVGLELQGVLAVPVPGFPVPRSELRLVASGAEEEVEALVASGYAEPQAEEEEKEMDTARQEYLAHKVREREKEELAWAQDTLQFSAEERRRMAREGVALPDGSFPIPDCDHAERAIRARGRGGPPPARRAQIERHIRKRVRALDCGGDMVESFMSE